MPYRIHIRKITGYPVDKPAMKHRLALALGYVNRAEDKDGQHVPVSNHQPPRRCATVYESRSRQTLSPSMSEVHGFGVGPEMRF